MNEAVTISATALEEQQALEQQVTTLTLQVEQLKQSKTLLQSAMLDQLAALRKQLQMERVARVTAESKLHVSSAISASATTDEIKKAQDLDNMKTQAKLSLVELAQ
jgi:hypothetical protein